MQTDALLRTEGLITAVMVLVGVWRGKGTWVSLKLVTTFLKLLSFTFSVFNLHVHEKLLLFYDFCNLIMKIAISLYNL